MSAGLYPAGYGPCGLDPQPTLSTSQSSVAPVAIMFDGATRDFPLNPETGRYYGVTSVAQRVELALLTQFGKTPAVPTMGLNLAGVVPVAGDKLQADVDSAVRTALAQPIANGDIKILEITGTSPNRGRIRVYVRFQDLRDPLAPPFSEVTIG